MLTVKVIGRDGNESVTEVLNVFMNTWEHSRLQPQLVYYFVPGESTARDVREGDVYVMNENGKTIADYHLCPPK
jgi:hypothetical protein